MIFADTTFGAVPIGHKFRPAGSSLEREKTDAYGAFDKHNGYVSFNRNDPVVIDITEHRQAKGYKEAFDEWHSKTEFVQEWANQGKLPGTLGFHRADILRELAEEALASRTSQNDPVEQDVFQAIKEMKVVFGIDEGTALEFFMPPWAIKANTKYEVVVGSQLCTKDGRRMGNAHVIATANASSGNYFIVLTDAGNRVTMTEQEIRSAFYISPWISDVEEVVRKFGSRQGE